jgi:serine/threonine-protein kinase RsbW
MAQSTRSILRTVTDRPITTSRSPRRIELKVQSDPANLAGVRKAIEAFATDLGFDEKAVAEIGLCVNEAMANVIRHAYANKTDRPVHIIASAEPEQAITITLRDWGNGVDPSTLPQRPHNPLMPGGVGLICLRQWMDQVIYTPQPDGMLTTLIRRKR